MENERDSICKGASAHPSLARLCILLVDDDESCLESVRSVLALDGHSIFTATRGLEAIEQVRRIKEARARLDLSILDFHMPDLTGIETYRRLLLELPGVPGIFVSGESSRLLEREVLDVGARALVRKPLDLLRIRSLIREVCQGREVN